MATAGFDGTVRLWDLTNRTQPRPLSAPLTDTEPVKSVALVPDGRLLVTARSDGTVGLWDLMDLNYLIEHAVERACFITRGGLDRKEWDSRIPGLPYQET